MSTRIFRTPMGWAAFCFSQRGIRRFTIGHVTKLDARNILSKHLKTEGIEFAVTDEFHPFVDQVLEYFDGTFESFQQVKIDWPKLTPFQESVIKSCRRVTYGRTATYADLARQAGSPRAARAVGNVMRQNRVPLVIPCHRIVSAGGIGGFSAPTGIALKERLLRLEASLAT